MTDTQQSETPAVVEPQTLDQAISDFNVPAPEAAPQKDVAEFTPAQSHIDPYDEAAMNKWAADTARNQAALQSEIQSLKNDAKSISDASAQAATDAKIQSAVKVIATGIEGIDPLAAEFILDKAARENEKFANLFHNQDKNPELFQSALTAIIAENESTFKRVDTQIAENHRAAQQSTQSNQTSASNTSGNSLEALLAKANTPQEQAAAWARIRDGG